MVLSVNLEQSFLVLNIFRYFLVLLPACVSTVILTTQTLTELLGHFLGPPSTVSSAEVQRVRWVMRAEPLAQSCVKMTLKCL